MAEEQVCGECKGFRFVRSGAEPWEPEFGKVSPCPVCVLHQREIKDWFADLIPTEDNEQAIAKAKAFAQTPDGWLVFQGPVGTGKTTLATAILSRVAGKAMFPTTTAFLLDKWRSRFKEGDFEAVFQRDVDATFAVLDDLGTTKVTDWVVDRLGQYLDWRSIRRQPTVITTNCDEETLAAQLGDRIADRVFANKLGCVQVVTLQGPSYRTGRQW